MTSISGTVPKFSTGVTDIGEPVTELRLGGDGPIDQRLLGPDPHDSSPGSHADQRTQAEHLEGVGEDVTVGPGVLVGQAHHRPGRRIVGDRLRQPPTGDLVADSPSHQLLDQQLADVAAAVEANVDHQSPGMSTDDFQ